MQLEQRIAVVTGGSSGIGAAVVGALRAAKARPVIWDIADGAEIPCDVSNAGAIRTAMQRTLETAGPPTLLVTCAGTGSSTPVVEMSVEEWDRVQNVNLRGTMLCVQAVVRELMARELEGAIACISSLSSRFVDPGMSAYSASKAGVEALVRTAATELGPRGIRVNSVAPGVTETPILGSYLDLPGFEPRARERTPLGRMGQPADIAEAVMALLQMDWVTGQVLDADGGLGLYSPMDAAGLRRKR